MGGHQKQEECEPQLSGLLASQQAPLWWPAGVLPLPHKPLPSEAEGDDCCRVRACICSFIPNSRDSGAAPQAPKPEVGAEGGEDLKALLAQHGSCPSQQRESGCPESTSTGKTQPFKGPPHRQWRKQKVLPAPSQL